MTTAVDPLAGWYDAIQRANDQTRATAKWLVTSFAAIGAILVGTLQLSSLGSLTDSSPGIRIAAVVAGAAAALAGVIVALWYASQVLVPFPNSFWEADRHPDATNRVLGNGEILGYGYAELKAKVTAADRKALSDPHDKAAQKTCDDAQHDKRIALTLVGQDILTERFDSARRAVVCAAILVAVGVGLFAWGANAPKAPASPSAPGSATTAG